MSLEVETLQRQKEDNGSHTLLGAAYGDLLNLLRYIDLTVRKIPLWPALLRAPNYQNLAKLHDQVDQTTGALGVKLPTVATS